MNRYEQYTLFYFNLVKFKLLKDTENVICIQSTLKCDNKEYPLIKWVISSKETSTQEVYSLLYFKDVIQWVHTIGEYSYTCLFKYTKMDETVILKRIERLVYNRIKLGG